MVEAYPLQWPQGWKRTNRRNRSNFFANFTSQILELQNEIRLLGGKNLVISTNQPLRKDGLPYAATRMIEDPGVAAYFLLNSKEQCIPCDKWDLIQDNIRGIVKTINALRGIERWGAKEMVDAAFRGFQALPAPTITAIRYFDGCKDDTESYIVFKNLAKKLHPDLGGNIEEFQEMKRQYEEFKKGVQ